MEQHAGREAIEVYGQPSRLAEVEAEAQAAGLPTRRTGTSISVLRADQDIEHGQKLLAHYPAFYQGDAVDTQPHFAVA